MSLIKHCCDVVKSDKVQKGVAIGALVGSVLLALVLSIAALAISRSGNLPSIVTEKSSDKISAPVRN